MVQNKSIGEEKRGQLEPIKFVSGYTVESVREGGKHRQESNNDISRRPAPNISIGEEMNGYQVCK